MMDSHYDNLLINIDKFNLNITLNRPEKRNALNDRLVAELKDAFKKAEKTNEIKTITLRGKGKAFCSGADLEYLKELKNYSKEENLQDSLSLGELFLLIYRHPKPVIAVVRGAAIAGGCGLASVCDYILADTEARFGYPEVKIGFIAAMVSVFLVRQIGERKARELLLTGKLISAEEAYQIGLINKVAKSGNLDDALEEITANLQANSTMAMTASKNLLSDFTFADIKTELRKVSQINAQFRQTNDFIEGITAFIEKRKPEWNVNKIR